MQTRPPLPIHLSNSPCPAASLENSSASSFSSFRRRFAINVLALTSTPTHVLIDCISSPSCVIKTRASRPCTLTGRPCKCWLSRLRYSADLVKRAGSLSSPRAQGPRISRLPRVFVRQHTRISRCTTPAETRWDSTQLGKLEILRRDSPSRALRLRLRQPQDDSVYTPALMPYDPKLIEEKWQRAWADAKVAEVDVAASGDKFYMLNMFPYPSGDLHVGHGRNYILGDALYRYFRMQGRAALNPMGWDAFGLPDENAAIKRGIHPRQWTLSNIEREKKQFLRWGILYAWSRELASCEPEYYRWNQWLFLQLYERGLAYRAKAPVNWCPSDQTVLANEQVIDGRCERCSSVVVQRDLEQWFLKITDYADRLDEGLDTLDHWPEKVKLMQRNWIGRSVGADVEFAVPALSKSIRIFTTRPDTIYGATFMVLAPEHPDVATLIADNPDREEIEQWIAGVRNQSNLERQEAGKEGRFTGKTATNPFTNEPIPIWLGNFVLMQYGTGAIMAVPGHDQRDFEFARQYGLPVRVVVKPANGELPSAEEAYSAKDDSAVAVDSGVISGLPTPKAIERIIDEIERRAIGKKMVRY